MQTFLPYADFVASAACLDDKRLGKQRVEVLQILKALTTGSGWIHHPATKMWKGYEKALAFYGMVVCDEYTTRGFKDTVADKLIEFISPPECVIMPPWFGHPDFHESHRSNLKRKDPIHYSFTCLANLPYCWPTLTDSGWELRFKHAGAKQYEQVRIRL